MSFDIVIRNGDVIDGTGYPRFRADVGIRDGVISMIGRIAELGDVEIDAHGLVVSPGFIDGHTHMDAQIFWDELGSCSCWHGVTTVVMGHCGFTLAPVRPDERALVVRNLERAEDISGAAMAAGITWSWSTFSEYLDAVDALPKGINYAANIGHSALRTWAMGERAFTESGSVDDIAAMAGELRSALQAGAWGFTTSRTMHHETSDGRPVASRIASWDEVCDLVMVMGDEQTGIFQFVEDPPSDENRNVRDAEIIDLAVRSGIPFAIGATGSSTRPIQLIEATAEAGGRMFGLSHCRGIGTMSSFRSQLPFDSLPDWQEVRGLPESEMRAALREPATRARLVHAAHEGPYKQAIGGEARKPDFERMRVMDSPLPPNPTVAEVAAARGCDPVEAMIDLALETDLDVFFVQTLTPFDTDKVRDVMKHPRTVMAFSDAGAHVSQMSDCSIQTHFLAHWVRNRQDFTLEEAVRMMSLAPARAWGFHDRGLLREGMVADINVFDPETVGPSMPCIEHDLPAGEKRIVQKAEGFVATIVNGVVTQRHGEPTGARPGELIRGPRFRQQKG